MMNFFKKQSAPDEAQGIIRTEMAFLLEQNERWFEKQLRARLLAEGCNFPMSMARPRFYRHMLSELQNTIDGAYRSKLQSLIHSSSDPASPITHPHFHNAIRYCASKCHDSGGLMALAVTKTILSIVEEWRLPPEMFQEDLPVFTEQVQQLASALWEESPSCKENSLPSDEIRQRLYLTLTTSLLSKINIRQEFKREFRSLPDLLHAMQTDHTQFCRFMTLCRERSPYFEAIASRTVWRTLETLFLEQREALATKVT